MCGIVGSIRPSMFEVLMDANVERGDFASGVLQVKKRTGHETFKKAGVINFDKDIKLIDDAKYYIGHVQAPTTAEREWEYDTSHPFFSRHWALVHNGVITNEDYLRDKYVLDNDNPVDTSTVVDLLEHFTKIERLNIEDQVNVIKTALSKVEGTYALIIVYLPTNSIFCMRQGSVLHFSDKGDISTIKGKTFDIVPEGCLFRLKRSKFEKMTCISNKSPYLFV